MQFKETAGQWLKRPSFKYVASFNSPISLKRIGTRVWVLDRGKKIAAIIGERIIRLVKTN